MGLSLVSNLVHARKNKMSWIKITDRIPTKDQEVLVWTGYEFFVAEAEVFDPDNSWYSDLAIRISESDRQMYRDNDIKAKGRFKTFGSNVYFNNDKVYWMEIPKVPESK